MRTHRNDGWGRAGIRSRQEGAVLYVALVMLILLALIGLVGMQVSGMQERMAANYLRVNMAFQRAEGNVRGIENDIQTAVNAGGAYEADNSDCRVPSEVSTWLASVTARSDTYVRRVDQCTGSSGSSIKAGLTVEASTTSAIYEVTTLASDVDDADVIDASSTAVIQTVYWP